MFQGRDTRSLGRRLTVEEQNQHRTDVTDFLKHHSRQATDSFFYSNSMLSYDEKKIPPIEHR